MLISPVSFTGQENKNKDKVRVTEVGVATGATVGGAKYGASAFKRFNLGRDVVGISAKATKDIKNAANAGKQVSSLWQKMGKNAKEFSEGILKWAKATATGKFATKVVNSNAFKKVSGGVGALGAAFVFISGIGEMGNMISRATNND